MRDALYGDQTSISILKDLYPQFLMEIRLTYEFDYVETMSTLDTIEYLIELQKSIHLKPEREMKGLSRKGVFQGQKKAVINGFSSELSLYWISWLMCIPGISEKKAVAIVNQFPTFKSLADVFYNAKLDEDSKLKRITSIGV